MTISATNVDPHTDKQQPDEVPEHHSLKLTDVQQVITHYFCFTIKSHLLALFYQPTYYNVLC
jgi:hypothetical protein